MHAENVAEFRQEHLVIGALRTTLPGGPSADEDFDGVGGRNGRTHRAEQE
jgi:hypothetical protein